MKLTSENVTQAVVTALILALWAAAFAAILGCCSGCTTVNVAVYGDVLVPVEAEVLMLVPSSDGTMHGRGPRL
ncbi:MAG: hypothetical protein GY851_35385 [bacterium]|nr:hypothetical protein [bacterium]